MTVNVQCWDCWYFTEHGLGRCPKHASADEKSAAQARISSQLENLLEVTAMIAKERTR